MDSFKKASTVLDALWNEIGVTSNERTAQKNEIEQAMLKAVQDKINENQKLKQDIESSISNTIKKHEKLLKALGRSNEIVKQPEEGTLREKFNFVNGHYRDLYNECKNRINEFTNLQENLNQLFAVLGYNEDRRGEFAKPCDDYSDKQLRKIKAKIMELEKIIQERTQEMHQTEITISGLTSELEVSIPEDIYQNISSITDESRSCLANYINSLEKEKDDRMQKMKAVATEITKLWDILGVDTEERVTFLNSHNTISQAVYQDCLNELANLRTRRDMEIPEIITRQRKEIEELSVQTHNVVRVDLHEDFADDAERIINENKIEIDRLKKVKARLEPIFNAIVERETMLEEQELFESELEKQRKLKMRGMPIDSRKATKDENGLRKCRTFLPRIEKKLKILLLEYSAESGEDFIIDGEPYINRLSHVLLSEMELKKAKNAGNRGQPRKSYCNPIKEKPKAEQIRRHSENNPFVNY